MRRLLVAVVLALTGCQARQGWTVEYAETEEELRAVVEAAIVHRPTALKIHVPPELGHRRELLQVHAHSLGSEAGYLGEWFVDQEHGGNPDGVFVREPKKLAWFIWSPRAARARMAFLLDQADVPWVWYHTSNMKRIVVPSPRLEDARAIVLGDEILAELVATQKIQLFGDE